MGSDSESSGRITNIVAEDTLSLIIGSVDGGDVMLDVAAVVSSDCWASRRTENDDGGEYEAVIAALEVLIDLHLPLSGCTGKKSLDIGDDNQQHDDGENA